MLINMGIHCQFIRLEINTDQIENDIKDAIWICFLRF